MPIHLPTPADPAVRMRLLRWWEKLRLRIDRSYRRRYEKHMREGIRWLMEHPEIRVKFDE